MNAVEIRNLTKRYGNFCALDDISLKLPAGRITGFIGPSGAGKTTLIRVIVGRQRPTSGTVTVLSTPAGSPGLRPRISYMTQETSVYPDLTVAQNLRYFAATRGIKRKEILHVVHELLEVTDMHAQADQLVGSLSGGQTQRVSLAVALIGGPELLVLDEPTVGLDPVLREQIWQLFRRLVADGTSIIISSHVMDEAERCDNLVLVRDGKVLAHDSPASLRKLTGTLSVEQSFLQLVGAKA